MERGASGDADADAGAAAIAGIGGSGKQASSHARRRGPECGRAIGGIGCESYPIGWVRALAPSPIRSSPVAPAAEFERTMQAFTTAR